MAVRVGSARISENGTSGWDGKAKAGDQTGHEVERQNWYKHSKGWVVLRAKDDEKREKIAEDMEKACDNNLIGYDQSERDTLWKAAKEVGFDCAKVDKKVETDCSALVRVCCAYAGIMVGNIRTVSEVNALMATGEFLKYTTAKYCNSSDYLRRGDVLVTRTSGHTVVVLDNGAKIPKGKTYFPAATIKTVSIVDALASIGAKFSFEYRKQIAKVNGIENYRGTALQNGKMLLLLKQGKLIKPEA